MLTNITKYLLLWLILLSFWSCWTSENTQNQEDIKAVDNTDKQIYNEQVVESVKLKAIWWEVSDWGWTTKTKLDFTWSTDAL
jgi:hypothetical protein